MFGIIFIGTMAITVLFYTVAQKPQLPRLGNQFCSCRRRLLVCLAAIHVSWQLTSPRPTLCLFILTFSEYSYFADFALKTRALASISTLSLPAHLVSVVAARTTAVFSEIDVLTSITATSSHSACRHMSLIMSFACGPSLGPFGHASEKPRNLGFLLHVSGFAVLCLFWKLPRCGYRSACTLLS